MSVCLRAEHLYKTFSRREGRQQVPVPAAQDLSLVLEEGDSLGIIGTSGMNASGVGWNTLPDFKRKSTIRSIRSGLSNSKIRLLA